MRGWETNCNKLRIHFVNRHSQDTIVILEEVNFTHPCCPAYEMFVPWEALNHKHPTTYLYTRGLERKHQRLDEEEARVVADTAFREYGQPLETVQSFRYLGRILTTMDDG